MADYLNQGSLKVNQGIEQPPIVNPEALNRIRRNRQNLLSVDQYVDGILNGNVTILSKAITLVESLLPQHNLLAQQVIERCLPYAGKSIRIGITGVPGAGKSTFIESFGTILTQKGNKLAVLAIDPSSERSKGSILGDKTRMLELCVNPNAFIRPSPSTGSLGGVARKTRESVVLCEAAGYNIIFIETVGVGQSETAVHSMVDFFLLLMLSGAGDELQGIKRGIMEMANLLLITKADGENVHKANLAMSQYQSSMYLFPPSESKWKPIARTCSSVSKIGLTEAWKDIESYVELTKKNGFFETKRHNQTKYWMYETINTALQNNFYHATNIQNVLQHYEQKVINNQLSSFEAARQLLELYEKEK